jgi:hypothetical protein
MAPRIEYIDIFLVPPDKRNSWAQTQFCPPQPYSHHMQTLKRFPNPRLTNERIIHERNNASNPDKASVLEPH